MYICDMCNNPIEIGTQYVNVFGKIVCLDCAVRNTLDDVIASFGIMYMEAPDDIIVSATVDGQVIDATPEQVENFIHSENPVFAPTQVGEKNTVLTTLSVCGAIQKKAWIYQSASDAEYWAKHYLKNMPNLVSIDEFVSEGEIPDGYEPYIVDSETIDATPEQVENFFRSENPVSAPTQVGEEKMTDEEDDDPNAIHEKNGWYYPGTDSRDEEMSDKEGD